MIAFDQQFVEVFNESHRYCFISRAREFQVEQRERLRAFALQVSELKEETIEANDEDSANAMLSFQLMVEAATEEVEMWIATKDERWDTAWNHLMNAQSIAQAAVRAHSRGENFQNYVQALHLIERLLFPPQTFLSSGLIVERMECSVCGQDYGECDHVVGRIYMGQICSQIASQIKDVIEVSFVKHPVDKKCRVFDFTEDGVKRDVMTWRVIPSDSTEEKRESGQFEISGVMLTPN